MNSEQREAVKQAVESIRKLCTLDCIPKNPQRDLTDNLVQRLMDPEVKHVVQLASHCVEQVGYEFDTRFAVETLCKTYGIKITFKPTEQDSFGWLLAKLVTEKGCIHYG